MNKSGDRRCFIKNLFLKMSQNLQKNTSGRVSFLRKSSGTGVFLRFLKVLRNSKKKCKINSSWKKFLYSSFSARYSAHCWALRVSSADHDNEMALWIRRYLLASSKNSSLKSSSTPKIKQKWNTLTSTLKVFHNFLKFW